MKGPRRIENSNDSLTQEVPGPEESQAELARGPSLEFLALFHHGEKPTATFLAGRFPAGRQRRIVTGIFTMDVDHPAGNPGCRMKEVSDLHGALKGVQPEVMPANVRQFVEKNPGQCPSWQSLDQALGHEHAGTKQAPNGMCGDLFGFHER